MELRRRVLGAAASLALAGTFAFGGTAVLAQEATPAAGTASHPAHIHTGSCPDVGEVVGPLSNLTTSAAAGMASPEASPMASPMASPAAAMGGFLPVAWSTTNVELALDDILGAQHALNVHLSPEEPGTYIACGNIGGAADADGNLLVGLAEQEGSGYAGIGWLIDNGDGTTTVTVFVTNAGAGFGGEMGEATPVA